MITSVSNEQVKNIIQLSKKPRERHRQGVFLAEGIRIFREIPKDKIEKVYASESFLQMDENQRYLDGTAYETVSDSVFAHMSDTQTPQGIMAVVRCPAYKIEQLLHGTPQLAILERIQDPGNLGTIFRTAEGAGATGIIMTKDCVDLFAPKTVRGTMGSIFRVPFLIVEELPETANLLKQAGVTLYAAHLQGTQYYDTFDYRSGTAFLIGNEGNGLTKETAALSDHYVKIPMEGKLESLNAAMSAGILMYEANRQRRRG